MWHVLSWHEVFVSDIVVDECSRGDLKESEKRLQYISDFTVLEITQDVQFTAQKLISGKAIPENCPEDALHIACAAVNNIDVILTWNFKHINNPFMKKKIERILGTLDGGVPVICSPEEFMEAEYE